MWVRLGSMYFQERLRVKLTSSFPVGEVPMSQTTLTAMTRQAFQEPLSIGTELLSRTLAERAPGRERDWARSLAQSLAHAGSALGQHVASLEEPGGDFAKLEMGSAAKQTAEICQAQRELLRECGRLRIEAELAAAAFTDSATATKSIDRRAASGNSRAIPDFGILRERAEDLLNRLRASCAAEIRLIMDGINTDIGGGD